MLGVLPRALIKDLTLKLLKELKTAISQYGSTAPYTLVIVEFVGDNWLTPIDWQTLTRATSAGGDYSLWKSEFVETCKKTARRNQAAGNGWTLDVLLGEGAYAHNDVQTWYDAGLFAQIQAASTKAWRKLPGKGDMSTTLTSTKQRLQEPFADFVRRLLTAAGRIFGCPDTSVDFVKQLAFENANAACQAAISPYRKNGLSGYIHLCSDIGPTYQQGLVMAAALQGYTVKQFLTQQRKKMF